MMSRQKKLAINTISSIIKQLVVLICGFILPRVILNHFGSSINGLTSSIVQFISLISVFDAGMGIVIQAALFKPLANDDKDKISRIMVAGQRFYHKFVIILFVYIISLAFIYPLIVQKDFDYLFTMVLVFCISISSFGQYAVGVTNAALIEADQKSYINIWAQIFTIILNTILCVVLVNLDCSIQIVKLVSSSVYLIRPIFLMLYVRKKYCIDWRARPEKNEIPQKWNGFAQHVAAIVVANTDIVVLTLFSKIENVSIYSVYFLVINGIKDIIVAMTIGTRSYFGSMIANDEKNKLNLFFKKFEWLTNNISVLLYSITIVTIIAFVKIYTFGISDVDYMQKTFSILLSIAYFIYCIRLPYSMLINAAGHFKNTQLSAILEAIINIVVSISMVYFLGLIGVAIGTICAMLFRLIYFIIYTKGRIVEYSFFDKIKIFIFDVLAALVMIIPTSFIKINDDTFFWWIIYAIEVSLCCIGLLVIMNLLFYFNDVKWMIQRIHIKIFKNKKL